MQNKLLQILQQTKLNSLSAYIPEKNIKSISDTIQTLSKDQLKETFKTDYSKYTKLQAYNKEDLEEIKYLNTLLELVSTMKISLVEPEIEKTSDLVYTTEPTNIPLSVDKDSVLIQPTVVTTKYEVIPTIVEMPLIFNSDAFIKMHQDTQNLINKIIKSIKDFLNKIKLSKLTNKEILNSYIKLNEDLEQCYNILLKMADAATVPAAVDDDVTADADDVADVAVADADDVADADADDVADVDDVADAKIYHYTYYVLVELEIKYLTKLKELMNGKKIIDIRKINTKIINLKDKIKNLKENKYEIQNLKTINIEIGIILNIKNQTTLKKYLKYKIKYLNLKKIL